MRKIGIIMVGLTSFIMIFSGILTTIYSKELMQWSATPPIWIWWAVFGIFLFGVIGFLMALLGD